MTTRSLVFAVLTVVASAASSFAQDEVAVDYDVWVPARDGVRLATDIYRPVGAGNPLPVLLHRTPYGKGGDRLVSQANFFAENGYVVAIQDMRGRFGSEGVFSKYHDYDVVDGYDTVEWLAKQDYSSGQVGMWGTSYGAHTQADAAKAAPPSLAALVLNQGGMANAWDHAVRHDGGFELGRELTWAFRYIPIEVADPLVIKAFENVDVTDWYDALPLRPGLSPLSLAPNFETYFLDELTHSDYDAFWMRPGINWAEYYEQSADVPMLHIGGWFDIFLRGTVDSYSNLAQLKISPIRLLVGPWTHGGNARTYAGDVDFGSAAAIEDFHTDFQLGWFDHFLKGEINEVADAKPVRLFVMGTGDGHRNEEGRLSHGGFWRDVDAWPPPETRFERYHFHADGGLRSDAPTEASASTTYTFDPRDPVPTLGGSVSGRVKDGAYDQREREDFYGGKPPYLPLSARRDVVVFQTEPLAENVELTGPIEVHLFVSSTAVDTDFTAKLIDVYPPSPDFPLGFDMNLTDALVRASYRGRRPTRSLIEPGKVYELVLRPFPTANVFKKGHRIRVDISSSNFPRFDVNPNTGEPLGQNRRMVLADNTIYHDSEHPSHILLPVIPAQ